MSAQGKLRKTQSGWAAWCPGCENYHIFDSRWAFNGDFDKPTFNPSMLAQIPPSLEPIAPGFKPPVVCCHSFVNNGQWQFLSDCTHDLAGQTIDLRHEEGREW